MRTEKSIYFPGINGLRFIAAFAVIITHIELLKDMNGFKNAWMNPLFFNLGGLGVYFFFVLSGFLITYLLLVEKDKAGDISIRQFYMRRILRIWPLYYFIILVGFFLIPKIPIADFYHSVIIDFRPNLILFVLLLPNLSIAMYKNVPNIGQAWSIGVEEQFYIVWPWIISKSKDILRTLLLIILGLIAVKLMVLLTGRWYAGQRWHAVLQKFVAMSKFECMAIGGVGAYYLFHNHRLLSLILNKFVLNISLLMIPLLIFFTPDQIQDGIHLVYSAIFLIIIMNVSRGRVKINMENKVMNYLGKISYGIYMYHFMLIPFVLFIYKDYFASNSPILGNILVYSTTILLTLILASLSYEVFELRFIRLKDKFSVIRSGKKDASK